MDEQRITELRSLRGTGMVSVVGEYTPDEFWEALDAIVDLRGAMLTAASLLERGENPNDVAAALRRRLVPNA